MTDSSNASEAKLARQLALYQQVCRQLRGTRADLAASSAAILSLFLRVQAASAAAAPDVAARQQLQGALEQLQAAMDEMEQAARLGETAQWILLADGPQAPQAPPSTRAPGNADPP